MKGVGIGAGYFARFHYEAWGRIPEVEMAAVCDIADARARAMAEQHGIRRVYTDWREMLERERPDFVDIITPPQTHEEMCAFAAARGIHIICQKPLAPDYETAEHIAANAERAGVRFMVHENFRWQPWYRKVKRIQSEGRLGPFTHMYFRLRTGDGWGADAYLDRQPFFRHYPRLLVFETAVHFIDTFRFLFGEVEEVFANLRRLNPHIKGEDTGQLFFRFYGSESHAPTAILDANRYNETESTRPRYTFGEFRIDAMGGHLTMDTESNIRMKPLGKPAEDVEYERADVNFGADCVYALQRHWVERMTTGGPFESRGEDYLKTVRVVEAVYESASRGQVVRL